MRWLRRLAVLITAVTLCGLFAQVASAQSSTYAPLDRQGPALSVPAATLAGALHCTASVARSGREPALLIPGTTLTPEVNFSWNYQRAFAAQGRPYCTVRLPNHAMSDIQVSAEYVVNAISTMHARSHNRVQVVGFSQGGMIDRWGLRFWPDLRPMVDDLIGIDPSNHGTLDAYPICTVGCAPSIWQQQSGSAFTRALNSGAETFAGISYTQVYTPTDEVVVPNLDPVASSALHTGDGAIANISTLRVCPIHVADHLSMGSFDPLAYAVVEDALTHAGPARVNRISRSVCGKVLMPGVNPLTFPVNFARLGATAAEEVALYPHVPAEPALKPYVFD